ncbi:MAG TPA: HAD-IC family P-type ATPase, partial [Magnetospirillaceae bacterium]|nr:HAD-IC family P-type ATPase [Magnetospirillaceae bacterium]
GRRLALIAGCVISVILVLGLLREVPLVEIVITSIALAVAAIPEGLPAVVTVTLAIGMHRMARRRAIVKRLAAVETLGCTTVICSDKTGTLTVNKMMVRTVVYGGRRYTVSGSGYGTEGRIEGEDGGKLPEFGPIFRPAVLANDSRIGGGQLIGDPTEGALLAVAAKGGIDAEALRREHPRIAEVPFDSAYKFQASFHREGGLIRLYVKGAPDVLLARSNRHIAAASGDEPLDEASRQRWTAENARLGEGAMRVLAMATKVIRADEFDPAADPMPHVLDLTLVGIVGILDPPRPEARGSIALCRRAGIDVKMITGDHRVTASAIARELGLGGEVVEGKELDVMSEEELASRINGITVFARVAPEHKVRIVRALKANGHVVAMTGDGVNDAPALKNADIGVAMGITGTEVTKEAATMVLTDDDFSTIVLAVKEGRAIYDNIVKFIRFQLSTNMGAIASMLGASLLGLLTPFTAIQILWVNIIMDGPPAMSLGVEAPREGIMDDPPRDPSGRVLSARRLARLFFYGVIMAIGTLGMLVHAQPQGSEYALTLAFTTFVLFQFFNLFNARNEHGSILGRQLFTNRWLWISLAAVVSLQVLVVHWGPAQTIFYTTALRPSDWALSALVASSILVIDELYKLTLRFLGMRPVRVGV